MDKEAKNKVLAMNKKFLSLIVVVLMVFQTITSTAFAQSSNTAATLNEITVAQMGVSVNRKSSSTAYIMYMSPIEDSSETFTAYYAIDKNEQMPSTADMSLWTENGLLLGNSTYSLNLSNLSAGPLYLHMVVTNSDNEVVAAKTTYMPSNICYIDDFEAYKVDTKTNDDNNILPIKHITTRYTSAIVASASRDSDTTKTFKVCGRYGSYDYGCSTEQYPIPSGVHSNISLELDVLPGEDAGWFGITAAGAYPPVLAGINLSSEYISTNSNKQESFTTDVEPTRNVWRHVKLDIDLFNNEYTDDFNGYRPGDYPQEFTSRYCNGSVAKVEGDASHNHAFKQGGGYGSYPEYHGTPFPLVPAVKGL